MSDSTVPCPNGKCPHPKLYHRTWGDCAIHGCDCRAPRLANDPVHQDEHDQQWYFWDETWADRVGPYPTEVHARFAIRIYGYYLECGCCTVTPDGHLTLCEEHSALPL